MKLLRNLILATFAMGMAAAQTPVANSAANAAAYGAELALGSMTVLFGTNLGGATLLTAPGFPLETSLGDASVQVTVNGVTVDGIMYYSSNGQSAFILPSSTPVGQGVLVFTYNGQSSAPLPVTVVERNPEIYTLNASGSGPGVVTFHPNNFVGDGFLRANQAANPGDIVIVWFNGLGPVNFPENQPALAVDMAESSGAQVVVGGQVAETVYYIGRQPGDASSVDVAIFEWPANIQQSCTVPVQIRIGNLMSNQVTAPSAASGRDCDSGPEPDPSGTFEQILSLLNLPQALANGNLSIGLIDYTVSRDVTVSGAGGQTVSFESLNEGASAQFIRLNFAPQITETELEEGIQSFVGGLPGTCQQSTYDRFDIPDDIDLDPNTFGFSTLNAGNINVSNGFGTRMFDMISFAGLTAYELEFDDGELSGSSSLTTTGSGSNQVDPFTVTAAGPQFNLHNLEALQMVTRANGLNVSWDPVSSGIVEVSVTTTSGPFLQEVVKEVTCYAEASAGGLNISSGDLSYLDATNGFNGGQVNVNYIYVQPFNTNLDLNLVLVNNANGTSSHVQ